MRILLWRETSLLIKEIFIANDFNAPDNTAANATATNNANNKNNASFITCVSKINGLQIDNIEDLDVVMPMYNLFEYSKNYRKTAEKLLLVIMFKENNPLMQLHKKYSKMVHHLKKCSPEIDGTLLKEAGFINITMLMYNLIEYIGNYSDTSGSLWDFKRDEIADNGNMTNDDNTPSFKYKANLTGNTETDGTKEGVKAAVPLKYLSNFWRSLEMLLIICFH